MPFQVATPSRRVQLASLTDGEQDRSVQLRGQSLVQQKAMLSPDAQQVQSLAAQGVAGSGGSLPHLDTIQQSFGRHDVGAVQAHVGGDAASATKAMGATAYATGNDVAFGSSPDLHTAAHEAAHIVQQRSGVQLKGGVGQVGDPYEQHADQVADLVVQGKSAEALLDKSPGGGGAGVQQLAPVQCKWLVNDKAHFYQWDKLVGGLRWFFDPDDGSMFFHIEALPPCSESELELVESLEGRENKRELSAWTETGIFKESTDKSDLGVGVSKVDQGPLTRNGAPILRVGFGTDISLTDGEKTGDEGEDEKLKQQKAYKTVASALSTGYRLFDTAESYGTMGMVGQAIGDSGLDPNDIFIVYKIKPGEVTTKYGGKLENAVDAALTSLPHIDCLMLHQMPDNDTDFKLLIGQMKELVAKGKVRYLGLSNAGVGHLDLAASVGDDQIGISFVQNKFYTKKQDTEMREAAKERGITYMGYNIMGSGTSMGSCGHIVSDEPDYDVRSDPKMEQLAEEEGMPGGSAQLALAWAVKSGTVQIPKTSSPKRMKQNLRARYMPVSGKTMGTIDEMDDVLSTDEQMLALTSTDDIDKIKVAFPNKTQWGYVDRLAKYDSAIAEGLREIGKTIGSDGDLRKAVAKLFSYVGLIDGGFGKSVDFISKVHDTVEPGDYSWVKAAFAARSGDPAQMLKDWWAQTEPCAANSTLGFGLVAQTIDDTAVEKTVEKTSDVVTVAKSAITLQWPGSWEDVPVNESGSYAEYDGKNIEFTLLELGDTDVKIRINQQM